VRYADMCLRRVGVIIENIPESHDII
jgi:hypothetical protein